MSLSKAKNPSFAIVGGGLAGCLGLHALRHLYPQCHIAIFEKAMTLAGSHTWCLHETDLRPSQREWFLPLVAHHWSTHRVQFPLFERQLPTAYMALTSEDLRKKTLNLVDSMPQSLRLHLQSEVQILNFRQLKKQDQVLDFDLIIDARGWGPLQGPLGYQKFLGLEIETESPHGVQEPTLMDSRVEQIDGFRFIYTLPLSEHRLLLEDTYYSTQKDLSEDLLRHRILKYAQEQNYKVVRVCREEKGILPLVLTEQPLVLKTFTLGASSGFYQPVTGYSMPQILQGLEFLTQSLIQSLDLEKAFPQWIQSKKSTQKYYRFLNQLLFLAGDPALRYQVLQRFYTLPEGLIGRFYAGQTTAFDKFRILAGKPPVPVTEALKVILRGPTQMTLR